jgi:pimeloyl-ACP methyl ester carboxylesterase
VTRLAPAAAVAADWDRALQRPWPGELEQHADRQLFVRRTPAASTAGPVLPPAVFVHGLGGQAMNWTDLMALLRERFACVAPDLPGFGYSPPPRDGDYSIDASMAAVTDLVEHEVSSHGRRVLLVGNSLGGAVCVRLASRRPDLVAALVLVSPALPDLRPRRGAVLVPFLALPGVGEGLYRQVQRLPVERQVQAMLETNFGDPSVVPASRRHEAVAEYRRRAELPYAGEALTGSARGLMRAFLDRGPQGLWREASKVEAPALLFYGGRDQLVDAGRARRAARTIPHARVVVLPGVGHMAQVEQPRMVARFVLGFTETVHLGRDDDRDVEAVRSRP